MAENREAVTQNNREDKSSGRKIVVVDDDVAVRESTTTLLESAGHTVVAFESGTAFANAGIPPGTDVILLDMMMPGLNGLETVRALKDLSDELPPIVMLAGHGEFPFTGEAAKLAPSDAMEKLDVEAAKAEME